MDCRNQIWKFFGLMVVVQLIALAYIPWRSEFTLRKGEIYKFKVRPIDPVDPFRGKFIRLSYEVERGTRDVYGDDKIYRGMELYAALSKNNDGFAEISDLYVMPPDNKPYIKVESKNSSNEKARFDISLDRYYMNEKLAKPTEDHIRFRSRAEGQNVYAVVRVLDGDAMIENVMVNDTNIVDWVLLQIEKKSQ